jgi:cyanophycinase
MLALVGSGEYLPPMEVVDRELMARLPGPVRVACLPTAAGTEASERIAYWNDLGIEHFRNLGANVTAVPVLDRASANDPKLAEQIAGANLVYLSGGKPDYLFRTLAGSTAWRAILQVLEAGGVLAGCSAGAMILGEKFFGFPGQHTGFGFLKGVTIVPHFDEIPKAMVSGVRLVLNSLTLVGIDGNTALVVDDGRWEVLGSGTVTVWDGSAKRQYSQGVINRE